MKISDKYILGYRCIVFINIMLVFIQRLISFYFSQKEMWDEYKISGDVTKLCIKLMFSVFIIYSAGLIALSFYYILKDKIKSNFIKEMLLSNIIAIGAMEVIIKITNLIVPSFPMPPIYNFCSINISTAAVLLIVYVVYLVTSKCIHIRQNKV